jgi:hypothetical protein
MFNAINLRKLIRVTTRDYPYESICYVGAILYGCPYVGAILYGCPYVGAILYGM